MVQFCMGRASDFAVSPGERFESYTAVLMRAVGHAARAVCKAHGVGQAWIVDDTGIPKKGKHSVGVTRQYCGILGKQDNCQVAVSVTLACSEGSLPVAWQLYLPHVWAEDNARRLKAGIPEDIEFATKPQIALQQIRDLLREGAPHHCVLADAGYGIDYAF